MVELEEKFRMGETSRVHPSGFMGQTSTSGGGSFVHPFLRRLRRAGEEGILLFVKHVVVIGLWGGTGYLAWQRVGYVLEQAMKGQLSYQYLQTNIKELDALIDARRQIDKAVGKTQEPKK